MANRSKAENDRHFERASELHGQGLTESAAAEQVAARDGGIKRAIQRRFKKARDKRARDRPPFARPGLAVFLELCDLVIERLKERHKQGIFQIEADYVEADRKATAIRAALRSRLAELDGVDSWIASTAVARLFGGIDLDGVLQADRVIERERERIQQSISNATGFIRSIMQDVPEKRWSDDP